MYTPETRKMVREDRRRLEEPSPVCDHVFEGENCTKCGALTDEAFDKHCRSQATEPGLEDILGHLDDREGSPVNGFLMTDVFVGPGLDLDEDS